MCWCLLVLTRLGVVFLVSVVAFGRCWRCLWYCYRCCWCDHDILVVAASEWCLVVVVLVVCYYSGRQYDSPVWFWNQRAHGCYISSLNDNPDGILLFVCCCRDMLRFIDVGWALASIGKRYCCTFFFGQNGGGSSINHCNQRTTQPLHGWNTTAAIVFFSLFFDKYLKTWRCSPGFALSVFSRSGFGAGYIYVEVKWGAS